MASDRLVINGRFLTQQVTGVQRVGIEFCRALDQLLLSGNYSDLTVEIVIPAGAPIVTDIALERIPIRRSGRLRGHAWEQLNLPWIARGAHLLALGNTAPLLSLMFSRKKTHVMVHDLSYRYFPEAYGRMFRVLYGLIIPVVLRRSGTVFTVSKSERNAILREYPRLALERRIVAVQNGSTHPAAAQITGRVARGRNCVYVGSLTKRKNAAGIIGAAVRLVRDHGASFTFVGSTGVAFERVNVDIPADVAERIHFLGQVNDPRRLSAEYSKAAVFLFPSFYEASPLPPIEAMAHGCPVVSSRIPSLEERCGDAAVYCDADSEDSIVTASLSLLDDPQLWEDHHKAGLRQAATYSWTRQASEIMSQIWGN